MEDPRRLDCPRYHMETMLAAVTIYLAHPELREGAEQEGPLSWEKRGEIAQRFLVDAIQAGPPPPGLQEIMAALNRIEGYLDNGVCLYGVSY